MHVNTAATAIPNPELLETLFENFYKRETTPGETPFISSDWIHASQLLEVHRDGSLQYLKVIDGS